jgi:tape measure domain-containing protein
MAAAELKLQVGLDLAFFRQQLALLGTTATGYSLPINIDRLAIQKEITKLGRNISNRSYTLKVKTTAAIAEAEVDKLKTALDNLQGKEVGIKITGTLGKIAPKDATKIRNDLAEAVAGGTGKKILVDVSVRENAIGEELRAVRKALNEKITPKNGKILVAASIRSGITNEEAKEFRESVKRKVGNIIVNVTGSADQLRAKEAKSIRTSLYQSIISNGGKIKIPATLTIADSEVAAFQKAVNSKFAGITVKVKAEIEEIQGGKTQAQIEKEAMAGWQRIQEVGAARMSGGSSDPARRESLRQSLSGRDIGELRSIGEQLGVKGARRYSNVQNLIEKIVADASIEMIKKYLDPQAVMRNPDRSGLGKVLDTFARGIFHMLGMDPAAMMAAQKQKLLPPSISWPASAAPPPSYQGKPGTMLPGAPAPTLIGGAAGPFGLLPRTTRAGAMGDMRRMLSQGAGEEQPGKLALSPEAAKARVDAIIGQYLRVVEVQIKEAFSAPAELKKQLNVFSYLAQSLRDAAQRAKQSKIDSAVDGLINALEGLIRNAQLKLGIRGVSIADLGANRPLLAGTSYPALPSAGETGKNRVRISTGNPFQSLPMLPAAGETGKDRVRIRTGQNLNIPFVAPQIPSAQVNRGVSSAGPTGRVEGRGASPYAFEKGFGSKEALAIEDAARKALKFGLATDISRKSLDSFRASQIPFIAGLSGVAGELGQATKQVLLYGTAYRALAAITSIPGQILDAAKSQQQYANGLKVATQETGTFAKELLFVDNVQRAFGLNLETTRTGFTRLYASMAPTGFDSGSIEKLFTGISAATAALQLTPDKAERVIYAFGQMASKGQIMSEELKGQLGDVLPGALAIFAKSAGMSVKEFSKAMEDGEFVGNRFREVFAKVSDELMNRFGTGAQVAGKSLQGLINTVGGDFQRTLESFAPLANAAAQATLGPLSGMLKQVSMAAQLTMGEQERVKKQLEDSQKDVSVLKAGGASAKEIKAAEQNVAALAAKYEVLNEAAKDPAIAQQVKNIEAFVAEVQKAATFTMNLAGAIGNVLSPFIAVLGGNFTSVIGNLALLVLGFNAAKLAALLFIGTLSAMKAVEGITRGGAVGATLLAGAFRLLGVQATSAQIATGAFGLTVKGLLISTGIGAVVVLLGSLAAAFLSVGDKAKQAADRAKQSIDSMADAARTGNVSLIEMNLSVNKADRQDLENLIAKVEKLKANAAGRGGGSIALTPELQREAKRLGAEVASGTNKDALLASLKELREPLKKEATSGAQDLIAAQKRAKLLGLNKPTPDPATKVDDDAKKANLESYYSLLDDLAKATTQAEVDRAEAAFNHRRDLINAEYDYREARANSFQAKAIAFQKEIFNIVSKQEEEAFRNQNKIKLAAGSVSGLSPAGGGPTGLTSYITGDPSQKGKGYQADHATVEKYHDHLAFATRELAIQAYNKLTAADIKVTEFKGYGKSVTGPHSGAGSLHHQGLAFDVPGYQWGGTGAIGAKEYAGSARVRQVMGIGGQASVGPPRKVPGSEKREEISQRKTNLLTSEARAAAIEKEVSATEELKIATARYTASLLPTAEQGLQNQLLEQKINLTRAGASPSILEAQLTYAKQELETNENIRLNTLEIEKLTAAGGKNSKAINVLRMANAELRASLPISQVQLLTKSILEQADAIISKAATSKQARSDENRINELIISGLSREQAEAKLAAEALEKDYAAAIKVINDKIKEYSDTLAKLNLQKAAGIALDKGQIEEYERLRKAIEDLEKEKTKAKGKKGEAVSTPLPREKTFKESITDEKAKISEQLKEMTKPANMLIGLAKQIGSSFSDAFVKVIDGTASAQEALAGFFKSIGDYLIQYGAQMLSLAIIKGILGLFGNGAAFDGGGITKNAKGNAFTGSGIAKFATGGIVNGPTLFPFADGGAMRMGLMGEAGPEAILPLQRGVDGALGVRAAMGGNGMGGSSSPVLNMNFETSTINGVEYVSRDQLEAAMAQTRRQASSDGAKRGMAMTLDKIQQSPQTRRRIGM